MELLNIMSTILF